VRRLENHIVTKAFFSLTKKASDEQKIALLKHTKRMDIDGRLDAIQKFLHAWTISIQYFYTLLRLANSNDLKFAIEYAKRNNFYLKQYSSKMNDEELWNRLKDLRVLEDPETKDVDKLEHAVTFGRKDIIDRVVAFPDTEWPNYTELKRLIDSSDDLDIVGGLILNVFKKDMEHCTARYSNCKKDELLETISKLPR
jgi:hypothetical protein